MEPISGQNGKGGRTSKTRPLQRLFLVDLMRDRGSHFILLFAVVFLIVGTLVYHWLEGWSYIDSLYFCVISIATVGYGDLSPTTAGSKAFTILYVLNGVGLLLALFDRIRVVRDMRFYTLVKQQPDEDA